MTSLLDERIGAQRPRVSNVPPFTSSAGIEATELAASVGLYLDDWQRYALHCALGERPDGKWAAFEVGLIVPRQNGKGSILEAVELAGLFLFGERLILHSAHEFKTAQEAFRRVLSLVEQSDDLSSRVHRVRTSHGDEGIELVGGARLRFVARSTGSGRGFTGDRVILDEAFRLPPEAIGALMPTMSARPNPQLWYASSAGHADSDVLRAVRDRGTTGTDPHLCYLEWSADPEATLTDPATWRDGNPAFGIRISEEHISRELAAMPPPEFRRERLGIWDDPAGADMALSLKEWEDLTDPESQALDPVAFGIDVSPDGTAAITAAGSRSDGLFHVVCVDHRPGTTWVAERLRDLDARWSPSAYVIDPGGPAGALLPELEPIGLNLLTVTGRQVAQSAVAFQSAVAQGTLRHLGQPMLHVAVAAARRRPLGDLWAFGRRGSGADIAPLVAASLALLGHSLEASTGDPGVWFV